MLDDRRDHIEGYASVSVRNRGGRPQSFSDEQVFRAMIEIVVENGMGGVSMPAIAKRIGYTHQAVTNRFTCRDNLLRAFGGWYLDNLLRVESRYRSSGSGALNGLLEFFSGGVVDELLDVPGLGGPAEPVKLMLEFDREPVLRAFFEATRKQTASWVAERIREAQREGDIGAEHDPLVVAETLLFAVSGAVVLHAYADASVIHERMQRAIDLALRHYRQRET